jgi:hypothetical protein
MNQHGHHRAIKRHSDACTTMLAPFEIEEEHASLLNGIDGAPNINGTVINRVRFRKTAAPHLVVLSRSANHRNNTTKHRGLIFRSIVIERCLVCLHPHWWQRQKCCAMILLFWLVVIYAYLVTMDISVWESGGRGGYRSFKPASGKAKGSAVVERGPHQGSYGHSSHHSNNHGGTTGRGGGGGSLTESSFANALPLPRPSTTEGIPSLSLENLNHQWEDYVHDPYRSSWSSHLYKQDKEGLPTSPSSSSSSYEWVEQEQRAYLEKMDTIRQQWGAWNGPTSTLFDKNKIVDLKNNKKKNSKLPTVVPPELLDQYANRDMPRAAFPKTCWQRDRQYVSSFLQEGNDLIHRVKEGIYAEYGHPTTTVLSAPNHTKTLSLHDQDQRNRLFRVITDDYAISTSSKEQRGVAVELNHRKIPKQGIAYLNEEGWNALIRKLLHAMMTNDVFYVVLVGPGSTYQANNMWQTQVMQFHHLMEPVFDLLGMTLVTRHMGIDAPTTISALGGGDVHGEADILWVFPPSSSGGTSSDRGSDTTNPHRTKKKGLRSENSGQYDLLHKQAILSGERVPILLTPSAAGLLEATNDTAWVGNIQPGAEVCPWTKRYENGTIKLSNSMPPVCRYVRCDDDLLEDHFCSVHDSVCWVPRQDWNPSTPQEAHVGNQDHGYLGRNSHQWEGRKLSLLVLHGIEAALAEWQQGINRRGFPLMEQYWHVGYMYAAVRKSVQSIQSSTSSSIDKNQEVSPCDELLAPLHPMICRTAMHAYTEWTPLANPSQFGLRTIASNLVVPRLQTKSRYAELYHGVDLLPRQWKVPHNEIDVHMIAIATNVPPLRNSDDSNSFSDPVFDFDDDTNWINEDDDDDDSNTRHVRLEEEEEQVVPHTSRTETTHSSIRLSSPSESHHVASTVALVSHEGRKTRGRAVTSNTVDDKSMGWMLDAPVGFCDGSVQSRCNRRIDNSCLLSGYNFYPGSLEGRSNSGWLTLRVDNVRNGILLARLEVGHFGSSLATSSTNHVYEVDYAVNGVKTTLTKDEFEHWGVTLARDVTVYPLLLPDRALGTEDEGEAVHREVLGYNSGDKSTASSHTVELKLRLRGVGPTVLRLSHLYYS